MAQITWQNVNAPDFRGATDGYKTFADLFSNSMGDLSRGVTAFQEDRMRANDNALLQDAMRYQDPAKLREALNNGTLLGGPDNQRPVSATALNRLGGMAGTLADQDAQQFKNTEQAYTFGNTVRDNAARDAFRPVQAALMQAGIGQNPAEMRRIGQESAGIISQLPYGDINKVFDAALNIDSKVSKTGVEELQFRGAKEAERLNQEVAPYLDMAIESNATKDPNAARVLINTARQNGVSQAGINALLSSMPHAAEATGDVNGLSFTPQAAGNGARAETAIATKTNNSVSPHVQAFVDKNRGLAESLGKRIGVSPEILLGQWGLETGWGKSTIPGTNNLGNIKDPSGKGTKAKDNMTGSVDAYRKFESPEAFGEELVSMFGRRYQSAFNTGADSQKYFEAMKAKGYAEDPDYVSKGTATTKMAANALNMTNPAGAVAAAARPAPSNVPSSQLELDARAKAAELNIGAAKSGQNVAGNGLSFDLAEAYKTPQRSVDEAADLLAKEGAFRGEPPHEIADRLEEIIRKGTDMGERIDPAVAAVILRRSMVSGRSKWTSWAPQLFNSVSRNTESGYRVDTDKLEEHIRWGTSKEAKSQAVQNDVMDQFSAQLATAKSSVDAARQELAAKTAISKSNPVMAGLLPVYQAKVAKAESEFAALEKAQRQSQMMNPAPGAKKQAEGKKTLEYRHNMTAKEREEMATRRALSGSPG